VSDSGQFPDAWQSRIGDRAADARRRFLRARLTGVILVSLLLAGAIWITVLFATQNGDPSPALVALIAVVGAVCGILGFAAFSIALGDYNEATDSTVAFVRHAHPDFAAFEAHALLRSPAAFDAGLSARVAGTSTASVAPANLTWTPDIVRPILPGLPQSGVVTVHRRIGAVAVVGLLILAALVVVHRVPSPRIWYSGWVIVGAIFLVSFAFWLAAIRRGRQEFREGYTTSPTGTQLRGKVDRRPVDAHTSLDFVDGKTGYLLRHANTVILTKAVYTQRLGQIRAAHPGATPTRIESQSMPSS
jgi:hypothetical protein